MHNRITLITVLLIVGYMLILYPAWASPKNKAAPEIEMVHVKGGCFLMGCGDWIPDCSEDEKPAHKVCLDDFNLGKFEVTQKQWQAVMGENPSHFKNCPDCPVDSISWHDATAFISKLNL